MFRRFVSNGFASRVRIILPLIEHAESRLLLSVPPCQSVTLQGTSGDDHILVVIRKNARAEIDRGVVDGVVTGADKVADGTIFYGVCGFDIEGGDGNDRIEITSDPSSPHPPLDNSYSTLRGGEGDDTLLGGNGRVTLDGGAGNDTIIGRGKFQEFNVLAFDAAIAGVNVNLADGKVYDDGTGGTDDVSGVGTVIGTPYDDEIHAGIYRGTLSGGNGNDLLVAAKGPDPWLQQFGVQLFGGAGDDTLQGGAGSEYMRPGPGNDHVSGGGGHDRMEYLQAEDHMTHGANVRLDQGVVTDDGSGGHDVVDGIEEVAVTSDFPDTIYGDQYNNTLTGQGGNDLIVGGDGNDLIIGFGGTMIGGAGNDVIDSEQTFFVLIDGGANSDRIELRGANCHTGRVVSDPADTIVDMRYKAFPGQCPKAPEPPRQKKRTHHTRSHRAKLVWQHGRWQTV